MVLFEHWLGCAKPTKCPKVIDQHRLEPTAMARFCPSQTGDGGILAAVQRGRD
ncbi:hypothetical protein R75465_04745 [Paraburkholderia aspalathi]|nr:hypothetical protein R75465_04745 [Paraburkholderia aspalathi]